ncbi:MAG TPA: TetR/AcrR family transcriptional regulator [Candidatus Limiplasma sp.]|nr:TetR/AcrR family transcriptional regulator [Candidatus Limiplasma sp.]HRX07972.1 TetR/AcrR family transcriptional regulator [Candidatus Limiplasma sp.]
MPQILKAEIKQKILDSALDSFLEYGYRSASMQQIAEKAGIATGNIYNYFQSKEEIFAMLVSPVVARIKEIFGPFVNGLPMFVGENRMSIAERKMDEFIKVYRSHRRVFELVFEKSGSTRFETMREDVIRSMADAVIRMKSALTPSPATPEQEVLINAYVTAYINGIISILVAKIDEELKLDALQKFLPFMRSKLVESLQ